jgi:formate hydrogenlyase subunit 6/NADH:ubiquinone oxidoreductase subunit I
MSIDLEQEVGTRAAPPAKRRRLPGAGLLKGLGVTLKHMLQRSITQEYPDEKPNLPPRTRGVIALKEANCTVCYKCSRECPDWCIYIDAHKETHPPASGGRARSVKVLDRFAIDYALCMYCGICVEVCPFDALFWAPDFEYAEYDILNMTHEKERLEEWTYKVLPPPPLEDGAEPLLDEGAAAAPAGSAAQVEAPAEVGGPPLIAGAPPASPPAPSPATTPSAAAPASAEAPSTAPPSAAGAPQPSEGRHEVEPDQETLDRVLAEELAKGTDRRVAEGRARAAALRAARRKAEGG